jgi:hypothetical protein
VAFDDGEHTLTIEAIDYAGNRGSSQVAFLVDTQEPRITGTEPRRTSHSNGTTTFTVKYSELNLENVTLFYGPVQVDLPGCPSGRAQECSITLDVSDYDGQAIPFHFRLKDPIHEENSSVGTLIVDTTAPVATILSPLNLSNSSRRVTIRVSSDEPAEISYSIDGNRFNRLCSSCTVASRTNYFAPLGPHTLVARAEDKAGNMDEKTISFIVV